MSRTFGFKSPQERIDTRFWKTSMDYTNVNAGRFLRNAVLNGKTYNESDMTPAFLKSRDAVHPNISIFSDSNWTGSIFGTVRASSAVGQAHSILRPSNDAAWWAPGGNGVNAWLEAELAEPTLVGEYLVGSNATSAPLSWKLEGSGDGTAWTPLHVMENTGAWNATYEEKTISIPEETRGIYLYYRLTVTASNSNPMRLRNLRFFRVNSLCPKANILIDASVTHPLTLSFSDGFEEDGITPVNHVETITVPILKEFDPDSISAEGILPVNIYAQRNASGQVSIETEMASGEELVQCSGGMRSTVDFGWESSPVNDAIQALFGKLAPTGGTFSSTSATATYTRTSGSLFVKRIEVMARNGNIAVQEADGTWGEYLAISPAGEGPKIQINRHIKGVRVKITGSPEYPGYIYFLRLYTVAGDQYKFTNGKVYFREDPIATWTQIQRIRLGTAIYDKNLNEIFSTLPVNTPMTQWMLENKAYTTQGN